jgi:putative DNA primase/helicase
MIPLRGSTRSSFEMDNDSFDEQQKKIDAFPLPPSMIMKTQKSYHVYWFMDSTAKVERFRMIQTQLVKHFDGDPMCVNESRVMRLPGFMHCKKDTPVEVTCVSFHPERKYTQDQLSDVLPEVDLATRGTQERDGKRHRPGHALVCFHAALPR